MKLIKNIKILIISVAVVLFELTAGKYLSVCGITPMLTFCFCLTMALFEEKFSYAAAVSAVLGAVMDIMGGHGFGTYTITFELAAALTFVLRDKTFSSKLLLLIPDVLIMTVLAESAYYLFHINAVGSTAYLTGLTSVILPKGAYNIAVCLIFYPVVRALLYRRR